MDLLRYRVTNFRSVEDSGWIDVDDVTAFIGVNESGKTNLLLPLWKLNPAKEGEIVPTADYPIKLFTQIRAKPGAYRFIEAIFDCSEHAEALAKDTLFTEREMSTLAVSRYFDGRYEWSFPDALPVEGIESEPVIARIEQLVSTLAPLQEMAKEKDHKRRIVAAASGIRASELGTTIKKEALDSILSSLRSVFDQDHAKSSAIYPALIEAINDIRALGEVFSRPERAAGQQTQEWLLKRLPAFVYYSNYGNLDSEIYLPQVVENLKRTDLGAKEAAKARTLRILFKFVGLKPQEILELGKDFYDEEDPDRAPTDEEIEEINERKKQRSLLLQSAHNTLTTKFREWWKQGDYRFRFQADGDHFRIWVSDQRRPEEVELEGRSTGLQWFLSFYLVFLVEAENEHQNAILLLDEPGLALHPLAQRDLSEFFDNLSGSNQLLYTTHSPFLVDADFLDRTRKVYVDADGTTKATADLHHGESNKSQRGATYAVYSALGLSVAESLLLGCQPVVVEGPSDQIIFSAIKTMLISAGEITPEYELVFPPAGGAKSVKVISSLLLGRDAMLPFVVLDDDQIGQSAQKELQRSLYVDVPERVLNLGDIIGLPGAEGEDLIPFDMLVAAIDRLYRGEEYFDTVATNTAPIVPQIEKWAERQSLQLDKGWKVEFAKLIKSRLLGRRFTDLDDATRRRWKAVFSSFLA